MNLCEICKVNNVDVHLTNIENRTLHICMDCNNKLTAEMMGIEFEPFKNDIYEFSGIRGKKHKFYICKEIHPMGISFKADELKSDNSLGFKFAIMDDVDCDQKLLLERLKAKIKKMIFKRYIKTESSPYGGKSFYVKDNEITGWFSSGNSYGDIPRVVVDGKEYSWDKLGEMLRGNEGFQFQLKIFDITENIE